MPSEQENEKIILKKVCVHNLKGIDLTLPKNELIVFTGVSGSGKSSVAFDTIYTEGQRRYVESLSTFARRQLGELSKPDIEFAGGISPTISIEQKTAGRNPRSTVGTLTEIYDYLRVLYATIGVPHCPISGEAVLPQSRERIIKTIQSLPSGSKLIVLSPFAKEKKAEFKEDFQDLMRKGYMRARVDGTFIDLNEELVLDGNLAHTVDVVIDRLVVEERNLSRLADSTLQALLLGDGVCMIYNVDTDEEQLFSMHAFSPASGLSYSSLAPHDFSFNSPSGMCPHCHGMGMIQEFNLDQVIDPTLSIAEDCCSVGSSYQTVRYGNIYDNLARQYNFSVHTPWKKLAPEAKKVFLYGTGSKWLRMQFVHPVTGAQWYDHIQWKGILNEAHSRFAEAKSEGYRKKMQKLMSMQTCSECHGEKLKPYPAATLVGGKRISLLTSMTISECLTFFSTLSLATQDAVIAEELLKEIKTRLDFLMEVGLHYLTLDRTAPTLSGGEAQRVRLASQIGCGLVGITYILDEPSIGLHPRDNTKLISTLKHLRDMGNTVIVVEHDEDTIWEADQVVDFGPGAGVKGGEILVNGSILKLIENKESVTGAYLSGRETIEIPKKRRKPKKEFLEIKGAKHHNLKNINVKFPLGLFIAVTGVSGSGKSSLITDILYPELSNRLHEGEHPVGEHKALLGIEHIDKVIAIDQSPIGRNPRSNPSTYIKLFDEIRDLFTLLPESQARGYKVGRFSFNVKEGSCTECEGMGMVKIDMDFMEDAWMNCPLCKTKRFDSETLSIHYKEKNIYDILEMDVSEALEFFSNIPSLRKKLDILSQVGMDYIKLGQSSTTLSGGEAQRIKLAKELVRPSTGKTLYILDEPTTGLHFHDIKHLLNVLKKLVDNGNSVIVIEHNMDVVKTADWIVDIGPEGGYQGGEVVATGTPEAIAKLDTPTGHAVHAALNPNVKVRIQQAKKRELSRPQEKKEREQHLIHEIEVIDAEQNNLKQVSVKIPREKITICTGPSGSGKSSLAFDTIYAEGQRRYIESLSPYARQFVKQMSKPKVGQITGLSPAIAIEQKAHAGNPRSTVGTMTEIYDYLRVLYARKGIAHCPDTGEEIKAISKEFVVDQVLTYPLGAKLLILAPIEFNKNEKFEDMLSRYKRLGYLRILLNGKSYELEQDNDALSIPFDRKRKNELFLVIDRLKVDPSIKSRLFEAVENACHISHNKLNVLLDEKMISFNLSFAVPSTGKSYPEITPHTFAFNTPEGMCPDCMGLGYLYGAHLNKHPWISLLSTKDFIEYFWRDYYTEPAYTMLLQFLENEGIDQNAPFFTLKHQHLQKLMEGGDEESWIKHPSGLSYRWMGLNKVFSKAATSASSEIKSVIIPFMEEQTCTTCQGARINPLARHVTIDSTPIHDLCHLPIEQALAFIKTIQFTKNELKLLDEVYRQLISRLDFLCQVGLHYLSLDRRAPTLSGGESQRIRLARQLGSGLTGVLYVLDEPTIGLHPKDNEQLNKALHNLKQLGNTLLMVEHDPLTVKTADYLLDFGPQSGAHGGHIIARGTYEEILNNPDSLTGNYLSGRKSIPIPKKRRQATKERIIIENAKRNNLKNLKISIPIKMLTCITGVSGSGKSTLVMDTLLPAFEKGLPQHASTFQIDQTKISGLNYFDKVISIDQNPVGHTNRSDVGTYVEVLTHIRELFSMLPAALIKGLQPKHFSYNHRRGMCTACWGMGYRKVEMHFLPAVRVLCDECKGHRLNPISLEVRYAGKNLGECLDLTVNEAKVMFHLHKRICRRLDTLISVGLGYLKLGQETASLSGGEAQRLKLSRELAKRSTGNTLYILDEPTTGLHSEDILTLLTVLHHLIDKGNTMVIIEHNLDIIKNADYVIELGPEAGERGGYLMAMGTPEEIAKNAKSSTGPYLKTQLK